MASINPFYQRIMSIALRGKAKAAPTSKKAPKSKGKKPKIPGFKVRPDIEGLDVFHVVFQGDAGADSEQKRPDFFDVHLSNLSKSKLGRLSKKINQIRKSFLSAPDKHRWLEEKQQLIEQSINKKIEESDYNELSLIIQIEKRLKKMAEIKSLDGASAKVLCKKYFSKEVFTFDSLVQEKKIIPDKQHLTGKGFVCRVIRNYLIENYN